MKEDQIRNLTFKVAVLDYEVWKAENKIGSIKAHQLKLREKRIKILNILKQEGMSDDAIQQWLNHHNNSSQSK